VYINNPGVYQIKNTLNGDSYIGSAVNIRTRKNRHYSELNKGVHHNIHLQRAWNKYGKETFTFIPLCICEPTLLFFYEQCFIDFFRPRYNIRKDATSNINIKRTDEFKEKVGSAFRGKPLSKEHIKNRDISNILNRLSRNPNTGIGQPTSTRTYRVKFQNKHMGCFDTIEEARKVYKEIVLAYYGIKEGVLFTSNA